MIFKRRWIICFLTICLAIVDAYLLKSFTKESTAERFKRNPGLPNGVHCLRNIDCASGCCILDERDYDFMDYSQLGQGVCVGGAQRGQVCGLVLKPMWSDYPTYRDNNRNRQMSMPGNSMSAYSSNWNNRNGWRG